MVSDYSVLDLFSGAGGLTEGFARNKFRFITHIEMDSLALNTLETRLMFHNLCKTQNEGLYNDYFNNSITRQQFIDLYAETDLPEIKSSHNEISDSSEKHLIKSIWNLLEVQDSKKVNVIIGGPPCQAYSVIGRSRRKDRMESDSRNYLYRHYISLIKEFRPDFFVFENVPGLTTAKKGNIYSDLHSKIRKFGYTVEARILNAADFGVLQNRKRIIFIGHNSENDIPFPDFTPIRHNFVVWNVLNDLPPLSPGEGMDGPGRKYTKSPNDYLTQFKIRKHDDIIVNHKARPHIERDREIYYRAIQLWNTEKKRLKYNDLPEYLKTHKNQKSFLDRFKVVNGEGLSHAIVAHIAKDGHYFIHPDIEQVRSLTVREAARIQSFPDNYKFEGPRTSQFTQIGNAVPPLMAEGIAKEIKNMLNNFY